MAREPNGDARVTIADIAGAAGVSVDAEKILECLRDARIVDGDGARGFALAQPADKISVARVRASKRRCRSGRRRSTTRSGALRSTRRRSTS